MYVLNKTLYGDSHLLTFVPKRRYDGNSNIGLLHRLAPNKLELAPMVT